MKVYMLRNPAESYGCKLTEGETGDVPAELGKRLVADGIAELSSDRENSPAEIRGIPNKPAIAESAQPDIGKHQPQGKK